MRRLLPDLRRVLVRLPHEGLALRARLRHQDPGAVARLLQHTGSFRAQVLEGEGLLLPDRRQLLLKPRVRLGVLLGALALVHQERSQLQDVGVDLLTLVAAQGCRKVGYADLWRGT